MESSAQEKSKQNQAGAVEQDNMAAESKLESKACSSSHSGWSKLETVLLSFSYGDKIWHLVSTQSGPSWLHRGQVGG